MHLGNLKNSIHVLVCTYYSGTSLWRPPLENDIVMAVIQGVAAFQGVTMEVYMYDIVYYSQVQSGTELVTVTYIAGGC